VHVVLIGGGLANCLIAYRLRTQRPDVDVLLLEREERLGDRRTWPFRTSDLSTEQLDWMAPLIERSWPHHEVRFPASSRRFRGGCHSVTSERIRRVVGRSLGRRIWLRAEATHVSPFEVQVQDGNRVAADAVVDGSDAPGAARHLELGYRKLLGQTVVLENAHGLEGPILMDATVPQLDGCRFVSTLPFSSRTARVEDTRYSDTPALDREGMREAIRDYARSQGWQVRDVESEQEGILPIVLGGDIEGLWGEGPPGVPRSGMRAALFHPTTGGCLPEAVRLADAIAEVAELRSPALYALTRERSLEAWRRGNHLRRLNRMLCRGTEPEKAWGQV
jgi:lycopene beta-cyclase